MYHTAAIAAVFLIQKKDAPAGTLANVAPTVLELLDLPVPESVAGESLIV